MKPSLYKASILAGMIGPALFVLTFTIFGFLLPDYDPLSRYISELSIGPLGWIQIANFLILGVLFTLFALGLRQTLNKTKLALAGVILLVIIGVSLFVSGPLVTDPSTIFEQKTLHGFLHGIFGAIVFSFAPITCFVFYNYFKKGTMKKFARWTLIAGVVIVVSVVLMKIGQTPDTLLNSWVGLIQRVALITYLAWIFTFSLKLYRIKPTTNQLVNPGDKK